MKSTCNTGDSSLILGQEDLLEKEMATCSNILAWENSMDTGAWQTFIFSIKKYVFHSYFVYLMSPVLINFFPTTITMELHHYKSLYEVERNVVV